MAKEVSYRVEFMIFPKLEPDAIRRKGCKDVRRSSALGDTKLGP
jgi:hypothetical protein